MATIKTIAQIWVKFEENLPDDIPDGIRRNMMSAYMVGAYEGIHMHMDFLCELPDDETQFDRLMTEQLDIYSSEMKDHSKKQMLHMLSDKVNVHPEKLRKMYELFEQTMKEIDKEAEAEVH